jgi:hypothetical protein
VKLKTMFIIAAVYGLIVGLSSFLAPAQMMATAGVAASSAVLMVVRFMGLANIGLGLIAWLVRNAEVSSTRDGVALAFTLFFALHALTSLYGQFTDTSMSTHWVMATLQGLMAIGFFIAGRAGMSTMKS